MQASKQYTGKEFKVIALREVPLPDQMSLCDCPAKSAEYWREVIEKDVRHSGDVESFYVLLLNTRRRVMGHVLVAHGTLDTILVHPREVFRAAIIANAAAVILMHNHPSGEPQPSEEDIKGTRDLVRGGRILEIDVLDHVIMGKPHERCLQGWYSLRETGYFAI